MVQSRFRVQILVFGEKERCQELGNNIIVKSYCILAFLCTLSCTNCVRMGRSFHFAFFTCKMKLEEKIVAPNLVMNKGRECHQFKVIAGLRIFFLG